ncbi:MAG: DUF5058 family protein [Clostridiales bacterium]|nr:DUF5058 family protein [Clostridiales bacterium]
MFSPNSSFLYLITAVVLVLIAGQSVFFLIRAWRRAKVIGIPMATLKKTVISSAVYTLAPAVSILLGVIALSKSLGLPLPWLRLSVIGAITYETAAAASATNALGLSLGTLIDDPAAFLTVVWVMTIGIMLSLILVVLLTKRIETGMTKIRTRDEKWGGILVSSLFLGMISAFLGLVFAKVGEGLTGWIPVFVMISSMLLMGVCGALMKLLKWKWLLDYALPISMLGGMALSIPITHLVRTLAQ